MWERFAGASHLGGTDQSPDCPCCPMWCINSGPTYDASFSVFLIRSRSEWWLSRDICLLQHLTPSLFQHPTESCGQELSQLDGGCGSARDSPASPAVCHSAAGFGGGKCSDCSVPGWFPLSRAVVTQGLICTDMRGPMCVFISCRISLCSVVLWT